MGLREVAAGRAILRNRGLRSVLFAYALSVVAEWALWTAILVLAYDRGGAEAAGITSLVLLFTAAVVAPSAGAAADGTRPNRVLVLAYAGAAVVLGIAAATAAANLPLPAVVGATAIAASAMTFVRPALSVVVPGLAMSADELTSANLVTGLSNSVCVLAGPLVAGLLLRFRGPSAALAVCAVLLAVGALASLATLRVDPPRPAAALGQRVGRLRALRSAVHSLRQRPGATSLLVALGGQYLLIGALDLLVVVIAVEQLHLGPGGPGYLNAVVGAGAALGGLLSVLVVGRARLAPAVTVPMIVAGLALIALGGVSTLAIAAPALAIIGLGRSLSDVTGRMLLQRAAPQDALASVFALLEAVSLAASAVGSILVQVLIAVSGVRAASWGVGTALLVAVAATWAGLRSVDDTADAPVVAIRLLRRLPIFAPLTGPALEGVARAARPQRFDAGAAIIVEGEVGQDYYAMVSGAVTVTVRGETVRTMSRGDGFGEIGLLADVPRTATIRAVDEVEVLAIDRGRFLTAVTGHDASRQTAWGIAQNWSHDPLTRSPDGN